MGKEWQRNTSWNQLWPSFVIACLAHGAQARPLGRYTPNRTTFALKAWFQPSNEPTCKYYERVLVLRRPPARLVRAKQCLYRFATTSTRSRAKGRTCSSPMLWPRPVIPSRQTRLAQSTSESGRIFQTARIWTYCGRLFALEGLEVASWL